MENLSGKSIIELENILKNFENEKLEILKSCATELRNRGSGIKNAILISKHFGLNDVSDLFLKSTSNSIDSNAFNNNDSISNNLNDQPQLNIDIVKKLNSVFSDFETGFGYILIANIIVLLTAVISFFIVINSNEIEIIQNTTKVTSIIYIGCFVLFLSGLITLINASKIKL
jgi:hypothetical protein